MILPSTHTSLCGSGFETVINGAEAMELDQAEVALAAGTENMSAAPFVVDGNAVRWGVPLGKGPEMKDSLWAGLTDSLAGTPMGITAENLGAKFGITREQCDAYGLRSQQLWAKAKEAGVFDGQCLSLSACLSVCLSVWMCVYIYIHMCVAPAESPHPHHPTHIHTQ